MCKTLKNWFCNFFLQKANKLNFNDSWNCNSLIGPCYENETSNKVNENNRKKNTLKKIYKNNVILFVVNGQSKNVKWYLWLLLDTRFPVYWTKTHKNDDFINTPHCEPVHSMLFLYVILCLLIHNNANVIVLNAILFLFYFGNRFGYIRNAPIIPIHNFVVVECAMFL